MKTRILLSTLLIGFIVSQSSVAQEERLYTSFTERDLSGPRLGFTFVPPGSELARKLNDNKVYPVISQFGWHFEYAIVPEGGGPSFVIEFIPMIGGVESPVIIPSASLAMGIRFPNGFEFGLGPNVILTNTGPKQALLIAGGKSIDYSGVQIPLNVAIAANRDGLRMSFIVGYAISR